MSVYFIARGTIVDQAGHDGYVAAALPTLPADCKVLSVDFATQAVEGELQHPRTVLLEFDSEKSFRAWYDSEEYQKILPQRLNSVEGTAVLCAGFVPPT
jgi:uncharacterized protein (DUF1330 family)